MQNAVSKIMSAKVLTFSAALLAVAAPALAVGCSSAPSATGSTTVGATAVAYNRSTHALADDALVFVIGHYTTCIGHADNDVWVVHIPTAATGAPLTVSEGNTACVLTIDNLQAGALGYNAVPPITLTGTYSGTASTFSNINGVFFYANADLSSTTFAADFVIQILTSDDPNQVTPAPIVAGVVVQGSATQGGIPAPDYAQTASDMAVFADSTNHVVSTTGGATYTAGATPGELYVIVQSADPPATDFTTDDNEFTAGTQLPVPGMPPFGLPTSAFLPDSTLLPAFGTLIIQHVDGMSGTNTGVKTYETFQYTFNAAP